jgi:hypothetical protein
MRSVLAIVSKAVFERDHGRGTELGAVLPLVAYHSEHPALSPLTAGGDLYLVTVRDGALWLVGVLRGPRLQQGSWVAAENVVPLTDVTSALPRLRFANGKGIDVPPAKLGMSLQTPRTLTAEDVAVLEALAGGGRPEGRTEAKTARAKVPPARGKKAEAATTWWSPPRGTAWEILVDDLHAELPAIARAIAAEPHPDVKTLVLAQRDVDGSEDSPSTLALSEAEGKALFSALPFLTRLVLRGHNVVARIAHPALEELELVGHPAPHAFDTHGDLPSLLRLRWALPSDMHGIALDPEAIAPLLSGKATPRLAQLDLSALEVDGEIRVDHVKALEDRGVVVTRWTAPRKDARPAVALIARPTRIVHGARVEWVSGHHFEKLDDSTAGGAARSLDEAGDRDAITRLHLELRTPFADEGLTGAGVGTLLPALTRLPSLRTLAIVADRGGAQLAAKDLERLAASWAPRGLPALELPCFAGDEAAWTALGEAVRGLRVERLDLSGGAVPSHDALGRLAGSTSLHHLELKAVERSPRAPLGAAEGAAVAAFLEHPRTHLAVTRIRMDTACMANLASAVGRSRLVSLHAGEHGLGSGDMAALLQAVVHGGVSRLVLEDEGSTPFLDDDVGRSALVALLTGGHLVDLTLEKELESSNAAALDALVSGLARNRTLTRLQLWDCTFSAEQAAAFARAVREHPTLCELHARSVCVPDRKAFARALGSRLTVLGVPDWLAEQLLPTTEVREVDSSDTSWSHRPEGARPFYAAAKASKTLERLDVRGTPHAEPRDAKELVDFVANAPALREIDVRFCRLRPTDYKALLSAITKKPGVPLEKLHVLTLQVPAGIRTQLSSFAVGAKLVVD